MKLAIGVLLAVICFGIGMYYLMPTMPHLFSNDTATKFAAHYKQAIAFIAAALVFLVGGILVQNGVKRKSN